MFLSKLLLLVMLLVPVAAWAQTCPTPNPNLLAPPFFPNCPLPAQSINRLAAGHGTPTSGNLVSWLSIPGISYPVGDSGVPASSVVSNNPHIVISTPAATIASGFSSGSFLNAGSSDTVGRVTMGSSGAAGGTLSFGTTYGTPPACVANDETTGNLMRASATTTQLVITGTMSGNDTITYICLAYHS